MGDEKSADGRARDRTDLENAVVPGNSIRECITRHERGEKRAARRPAECARNRADEEQEVNQRNRWIIKMKRGLVALENRGDAAETAVARPQDRNVRDSQMLP